MGVSVGWIFAYPYLLALLLAGLATSQYIDRPYDNSGSNNYADPLRGTLGVWARLLSRMAQTNPPTDDQLHLRDEKGGNPFEGSLSSASTAMKDIYDNMRSNLNKLAHMPTNLVMGGGGSAAPPPLGGVEKTVAEPVIGGDFITVPVQTTASPTAAKSSEPPPKIINEKKLLELLPRLRENPSTQPSPTTPPTSTTPTTLATSTTGKKGRRKKSKQGKTTHTQSTTASDTTTTTAGESIDTSSATTATTSQATPHPSLSTSDSTQASSTTSSSEPRTSDATMSVEESNRNDGDRNDTTASSVRHDENSTLSSTDNETAELITEIENVLKEEQWIFHNRRRGNNSHFDAEKEKHISAALSKNNSADEGARNEETHPLSSNGKDGTAESTAADDDESKEPSESEPESSESDESSEEEEKESTPTVKEHGENNDSDYSKIPISTLTTATPTSTSTRVTTTTVTTTTKKSATVQSTYKTVRKKDHKKISAKDTPKKKLHTTVAPKGTTRTLPEAEEEEKAGDVAQQHDASTTTSKPKPAKLGSLFSGPTLGIDSYSSKDMASMIRPVNTIIDGIGPFDVYTTTTTTNAGHDYHDLGPLILPLLGYSREALAGSYAPPVSLVSPRVKTGVAIHRPGYAYHQPPPSQVAIRAPAAARQYAAVQSATGVGAYQRVNPDLSGALSGAVSSQVPQTPVLPKYPPSSRLHPNYRHVPTSGAELPSDSQPRSHAPHARYMPDPPVRESHVAPAYLQRLQQAAQLSRNRAVAAAVAVTRPQQPNPAPNVFSPDTIRQTLDTILLQRRANQQGPQGQTSSWEQQPSVNHQAPPVYEQEPLSTGGRVEAESKGDSGYDAGRSGVEKTFFEDSGVMIGGGEGGSNNKKQQQKSSPFGSVSPFGIQGAASEVKKAALKPGSSGTIGFGGGRQPDMGFEEVSANTSNFQ